MFLKGVWFIIAAVLLLGHTPALAEPYLRVCKDGVVYYHFTSREPNQPGKANKNTPKTRGEAWIEIPPPRHQPALSAAQGPTRARSKLQPEALSPTGPPAPGEIKPGTLEALPVLNSAAAKSRLSPSTHYLLGLLAKLGYRYPPVLPASAGLLPVARQQEAPAAQATQVEVPEGWKNLLKQAQEQPAEFWQALPGTGAGPLRYCFPVAGPFSFRDTWGEPRSGGRVHRAVDIFAPEGSALYAITSGVVDSLSDLPGAGVCLFLRGQDGRGYGYMHLQGYAPGLIAGKVVRTGELIGYVGRTGVLTSAAHLHLQVYADQRFCKDELLNPYVFLVQLCRGIGVTDLYQPKIARLEVPESRVKGIQVYRRPKSGALRAGVGQFSVRDSSITVIKNF